MTADTVGGVWTYAIDLARALSGRGVHTTLASMGKPASEEQRRQAAGVPGLDLRESDYRLEWMSDPWDDLRAAGEWLLGLERETRPDLVHLNGYVHGALPFDAPVLVAGHSCVLSWWEAVRGGPAGPEWGRYRAAVTRGLRAAAMVVAPTAAMLAALERHYGPLPPSRVVPNGRDPSAFTPGDKEPFVLTVGRLWDDAKNLAAVSAVAPALPWKVVAAGDAGHPDGGRAAMGSVEYLGTVGQEELAGLMARAAVFALPARYEPFGLAALEAGLSGCALVLGDIPSLREVWGDAAVFVRPDDHSALELAISTLALEDDLRSEMGRRARQRALDYGLGVLASRTLDAYHSLLGREADKCAS